MSYFLPLLSPDVENGGVTQKRNRLTATIGLVVHAAGKNLVSFPAPQSRLRIAYSISAMKVGLA